MKFLLHFTGPLCYQTGRADHQHSADKTTALQLLDNHACLDSFTETYLVRQNIAEVVCLHCTVKHMELMRQWYDTACQ